MNNFDKLYEEILNEDNSRKLFDKWYKALSPGEKGIIAAIKDGGKGKGDDDLTDYVAHELYMSDQIDLPKKLNHEEAAYFIVHK
jgi:hypothetical protein